MKPSTLAPTFYSVFIPAVLGFGCAYVAAVRVGYYGWSLFIGLPFLVTFGASFLYRRSVEASLGMTYAVALVSLLALGAMIIFFALDGLICLFMALPLAMLVALAGTAGGFCLAQNMKRRKPALFSLLAFLVLPVLMGFEKHTADIPTTHVVVSRIAINAPIERVWQSVIAFDRITSPPRGIFRMGVAYPIEARIEGIGAGAIRHCVFSTGAFVEPITEWDEPNVLAFDVIENPPTMKELSFHKHLDTPHLHGTFESTKGQFKLWREGEKTILEGTTWYRQKLFPDWYWHRISNEIVHRIHLRVLEHIRDEAAS